MKARAQRGRSQRPRDAETTRVRARVRRSESALPSAVETALQTPGEPLEPAARTFMEERLGHRFDDVRVHSGPEATRAAALLEAEAFTSGRDIVFGSERYRPETPEGRRLLAHELVHTLQQGRDSSASQQQGSGIAVRVDDPSEREADAAVDEIAGGSRLPSGFVTVSAPAARRRIARQATAALARQAPVEVPESPEAVEAVTEQIERLLIFDPQDTYGRVRRRVVRLAPSTRRAILTQLSSRVSAQAAARLTAIVAELAPSPGEAEPFQPAADGHLDERATTAQAAQPVEEESEPAARAPELADAPPETADAADLPPLPEPVLESEQEDVAAPPLADGEVPAVPEAPSEAVAEPPGPDVAEPAAAAAPAVEPEQDGPDETAVDSAPINDVDAQAADSLDDAVAEQTPEDEVDPPDVVAREAAGDPEVAGAFPPPAGAIDPGPETVPEEASPPEPPGTEPADVAADNAIELVEEGEPAEEPAPDGSASLDEGENDVGPEPTSETATPEEDADTAVETGDELDTGASEEVGDDVESDDERVATGGGKAGTPIEVSPEPDVPDLSGEDPVVAMQAAASLPPVESQAATAGVAAAASRSVSEKRTELAESPPQLERPSGAPTVQERAAEERALPSPGAALARVERTPEGAAPAPISAVALPPAPAPVAEAVRRPVIAGDPEGALSDDGRRALGSSIRALPKTDPDLNLRAGPAPELTLAGSADPQRAQEQRARLTETTRTTQTEGRRDVVQPMGETELYPEVPPETLRATIAASTAAPVAPGVPPARGPAAGASDATAAGPSGQPSSRAISAIAQQERGDEIRGAAGAARSGIVAEQDEQVRRAGEERARSEAEVAELVQANAGQQTTERSRARQEVHEHRVDWAQGQQEAVTQARTGADTEMRTTGEVVDRERTTAQTQAATHIEHGDRDAATERRKGEEEAERERKRGEEESSKGFFGWLAKKASDFFDAIKRGIQRAFAAARAAVRAAINKAKQLAVAAIEKARSAIVAVIKKVGEALIAIGDTLLAAFPGLRDRFRKAIKDRVDRAVAKVNELADALKQGVQKALDLLGAALDAALGLLEKGLLFVVDSYAKAVQGAIKFAESVVQAFAVFAALIGDIAADPLQWLFNLGASAKDGVRNHLWKAFKRAIKRWFNEKLEEVLGLGLAVWNLLKRGGISLAKIGKMAWGALKAAIPTALIQILIEKLIALIIPAAGAIMAIIEGISAAWGTIRRVLEAFERFFIFLKAVKTGRAGPQFANAVAAAAIVVIDFVANWLLKRMRKPAGAIAKRIRAMAKKLGAKLRKLVTRLGRGKKLRPKRKKAPDRRSKDAKKQARKRERERRAIESTRRTVDKVLSRAIGKAAFGVVLKGLKLWHRFRRLRVVEKGSDHFDLEAGFSPDERVISGLIRKVQRRGKHAFVWNPKVNYAKQGGHRGVLDFAEKTKYAIKLSSLDRGQQSWHGHHTWPVNELGGAGDQPLVGARGALHNSILHVWLRIYITARLKLKHYHSSEIHRRVLDGDLEYADVRRALYAFYASKFPMVPRTAWALGIEFTFKKLPTTPAAIGGKLRKAQKRRAKARAKEKARG